MGDNNKNIQFCIRDALPKLTDDERYIEAVNSQFCIRDALPKLTDDERYIEAVNDGNVEIGFYAPRDTDTQSTHTRDEIYVVVEGRGMFIYDNERHAFGPGDVLMVPAGVNHQFEDFTDDLMIWAVFYGPEGGHAS